MKHWIFIGIILVAAFFRIYNLEHVPPSPSLDEVSIGYNAYSILMTGLDEYGTAFPLLLRAYDDYRPALYAYLTMPFLWLLGLTVLAVRLPSVILSLVTIYIAYRMGGVIGKKYLSFFRLGEVAAMLLAISPWHIYLSRLGHEVNAGLALVAAGLFFVFGALIDRKSYMWIAAAVSFGLSLHGYQSEKVVVPLLLLIIAVLFWKELWRARRLVLIAAVAGLIIVIPAIRQTISPGGMARFRGTSAFSESTERISQNLEAYVKARENNDRIGQIIHSRYVSYALVFMDNYLSHFSLRWLFSGSEREAHKVPGLGLLYLFELPLLVFGLWGIGKAHIPKTIKLLMLGYVFIVPVPASITSQAPHAMRSFTMIPLIQIIEAIGVWFIVRRLTLPQLRVAAAVLGLVVASGLAVFWDGYFVRFPKEQSDSFQYAMKDAVRYATQNAHRYDRVEFSNQGNLYQSYMFFLYYSAMPPEAYQSFGGTVSGGYEEAHSIGDYSFGILPNESSQAKPDTLYLYDASALPNGFTVRSTFINRDGAPAIVAATL